MLRRSAYDQWIAELCRDAEESALERDRLKAKLEGLREDHKRKVMAKILGRLGNMQYFVAWSAWYNATVKMHQMEVEAKIRELKKELKTEGADSTAVSRGLVVNALLALFGDEEVGQTAMQVAVKRFYRAFNIKTVSYTHLTLPTILRV